MTSRGASEVVVGVDLGGTKIEVAIFHPTANAPPQPILRRRIPTLPEDGYEALVQRCADFVRTCVQSVGISTLPRVGVGMPGSVSRQTGLVKNSNTTCLNGRPFRQDLCALLAMRVRFANDANCLALAETRWGAAQRFRHGVVFAAILGTGVGGGWVVRGLPWGGQQGLAGEWGHHTLEPDGAMCYCGRKGCAEMYLAGPRIEHAYAARAGEHAPLAKIMSRAEAESPVTQHIKQDFLKYYGRALGNVINIMDPDIIVLGGGVSNLPFLYTAEGHHAVAQNVFNDGLSTPIVPAILGDSSGVLGAGMLAALPEPESHALGL